MAFSFNSLENTADRTLFDRVSAESINLYGIDIEYLVVSMNDAKDPLYVEDTLPTITERHLMKGYGDLIQEDFLLNKFGMQSDDQIDLQINKTEFERIVGQGAAPKSGDFVYVKYMERLFVISNVDSEDSIFLQKKFTWNLNLKAADINGELVDPNVDMEDLPDIANEPSDFDDNALINALDNTVVVTKTNDSSPWGAFE